MFENGTKKRPIIIPIFIPNQGCPYRCIYCQQEKITSHSTRPVNGSVIKQTLNRAIKSTRFDTSRDPEVAFYGGTFTGLPASRMEELLGAVTPYLKQGFFRSIRVSTRPDSLGKKQLDLMRRLGVFTVELGTQSMDDRVLELSRRGHRAGDTVESVHLLKQHGFRVGIQLMPGLPGDSEERFMRTVEEVIKLRPDMARLYPTIVIKGTELAEWYREKKYHPLSLEEAVKICKESCTRLEGNGIPVIRIGLMSSPSLLRDGQIVAGPWHRAFGFLVRSAIHQEKIEPFLPKRGSFARIRLRAPYREIPLVKGYKNLGLRLIEDKTDAKVASLMPDDSIPSGQIGVEMM